MPSSFYSLHWKVNCHFFWTCLCDSIFPSCHFQYLCSVHLVFWPLNVVSSFLSPIYLVFCLLFGHWQASLSLDFLLWFYWGCFWCLRSESFLFLQYPSFGLFYSVPEFLRVLSPPLFLMIWHFHWLCICEGTYTSGVRSLVVFPGEKILSMLSWVGY